MKDFEFYIERGEVRRQRPDKHLAQASYAESLDRIALAKNMLGREKPKYVLENAYEAIREAADGILYNEGYKSYSHEASIVYLLKKGFSEREVIELDRFRKIRNDIKYYGKGCDKEDADAAIVLAEKIIPKVRLLLER